MTVTEIEGGIQREKIGASWEKKKKKKDSIMEK